MSDINLSSVLYEEMVQVNSLDKEIFLLKYSTTNSTRLILFNAPKLVELIKTNDLATQAIVAAINYQNASKYQEIASVGSVAAIKGFGPTIYEIALADAEWLQPDYEVSGDAENVWKKFFQRNDVEKRYLKDPIHPSTRDVLNYAYHLKNPSFDLEKLINDGNEIIETIALDLNLRKEQLEQIIVRGGQRFFGNRYVTEQVDFLDEAAMTVSDAESLNLALYILKDEQELILYSPEKFLNLLENIYKDDHRWPNPAGQNGVVFGEISVFMRYNKEVSNVQTIAAEPGFGPLMYELAMSVFGPLTHDEETSTSIQATDVWNKFSSRTQNSKDNIEKRKRNEQPILRYGQNPIQGVTGYKFRLKKPHDYKQLVKNHEETFNNIALNKRWANGILLQEAEEFFKIRYRTRKK